MDRNGKKRVRAIEKELALICRQERRLEKKALGARAPGWKTALEQKLPEKVYAGLEHAFAKGFSLVFQQGRGMIEKTCRKKELQDRQTIRDVAFRLRGTRKELKRLRKETGGPDLLNLAVTTAEGIGLGALGIGMPDIVLFLAALLKGIYETALSCGFDYDTPAEQVFLLKLMEAALSTGEDWVRRNGEVDCWMEVENQVLPEQLEQQIRNTASAFASDLLVLKFIQGLPVVGILGGAANPVYYNKVMKYAKLKYRKRYLLGLSPGGRI